MFLHHALINLYLLSTSAIATNPTDGACRSADASFRPAGLAVGDKYLLKTSKAKTFTLNPKSPIATIDCGTERAGIPFFEVSELETPVQVEVKYSEAFLNLQHPWSDGPYLFNTAQGNSFRVETIKITQPGCYKSTLLQGGQRWQSF